jgi:CBS domain-containing protein
MPNAFDFSNPPYDRLTGAEQERLRDTLDIAYIEAGETVVRSGEHPEHMFCIIKGFVEEFDGDELVAIKGPADNFDYQSMVDGQAHHRFVVREDLVTYLIPRTIVAELMQSNPAFGAFFYQDISQKLDALATLKGNRELNSLMMARVGQAYIHPALYIDASASLYEAGCLMRDKHTNSLLVRDGDQVGVVTGMNMCKAMVLNRQPIETPIGSIAHFDVITVKPDDFLYTALIEMTRHKIRRIVVKDGDDFVGVLDEIDLLSFLSSHSHIVAVQVDRATTKQELREASQEIVRTVRIMHNNGVKVRFIAQLVSELTRQILAKLFRLLATPNIDANTCLMVMGSEGRGEQIMKTDQDNALLLRDGAEIPELEAFTKEFTDTLLDFGYPLCPGGIMVSNEGWCKDQQGYKDELRKWILLPDDYAPINLAIFQDAVPVAGDSSLLKPVRDYMFELLSGNDAYVANFARTIDTFATPLGLFFNLVVDRSGKNEGIDVKKGGLFPIVHGVRSLALKHRVVETGTIDRIRRLRDQGVIEATMANELIESFSFLLELRLRQQLARLTVGVGSSSIIRLDQISSLERDLLKDSLFVVKKFKETVRHHFRISVF